MPLPVYSPHCMNVNAGIDQVILSYLYSNLEILVFLKLHGITISIYQRHMVKKITVMKLLRELDPEGVESGNRK